MIVHLRQIGDYPLPLQGKESAKELSLEEADVLPAGNLEYQLEAGLSDGGLWVHGRLRLPVRLTCVSCLEPFDFLVEVPEFSLQIEVGGKEHVDLTNWIREDILLALPPYPKCDSDGGRKCPTAFPPVVSAPAGDVPGGPPSAWAALDQIKPQKKS